MSDSNTNIMSIRELIDNAFGDPDVNIVNHKHIQSVLFILASQMRLLERRVEIVIGHTLPMISSSKLNISEIIMHTMQKKKKKTLKDVPTKQAEGAPIDRVPKAKTHSQRSSFATAETLTSSSSDKKSIDKSSNKQARNKPTPKSTDDKTLASTDKSKKMPQDSNNLLDTVEQEREKQLRVIHQRADSREEHDKAPTPMASLDSVEAQYEKLLVVERIPAAEAEVMTTGSRGTQDNRSARGASGTRTTRLSIVTQDQFEKLSATVRELQALHAPVANPDFPDNAQLMADLRKGASLTDAMAALQLSARLEAAEKALEKMLSLVTELARQTPGINLEVLLEEANYTHIPSEAKAPGSGKEKKKSLKEQTTSSQVGKTRSFGTQSLESIEITQIDEFSPEALDEASQRNRITRPDLDAALKELYDDLIKHVTLITTSNSTNADNAFQKVSKLEVKVEASLELGNKMNNLEVLVSDYADQINILDTGLSSQMTNYQEQLTQMQHDLEIGLETMAEVLANTGGDIAAIAELNGQYNNLQLDIDNTIQKQRDLKDTQNTLAMDLQALWKQIELLRELKSDRDEVADALRDKVGIGELNGFVSLQQFDAVRGDFEKRICSAYDKFNSQETIWQKAIDELLRDLNEKCDVIQVDSLKEEIEKHLNKLKSRMLAIMEIVGEPRAAALARQLHRDTACLSCATPAFMNLEEPGTVPALPQLKASRPPTISAETQPKPREDGDHELCYPGLPISHPMDQRTHVCNRYCGGSHTLLPTTISRAPPDMVITQALRQTSTELGSDGKVYMTDNLISKKPCFPCNVPKTTTPEPSEHSKAQLISIDFNMTPDDLVHNTSLMLKPKGSLSMTPPPHFIND